MLIEQTKVKQVIVLRTDLNMRKGKMVAQGAHAAMAAVLGQGEYNWDGYGNGSFKLDLSHGQALTIWLTGKFTKICVAVNGEDELKAIYHQALKAGLPAALIQDSGLTEFKGIPTYTAVAIGPADITAVDSITSHLKLL